MSDAVIRIDQDDLYPRDEDHRLRLYARHGEILDVLAAFPVDALGRTLVQLTDDELEHGSRLDDAGALGVYDAVTGAWLISPWHKRESW